MSKVQPPDGHWHRRTKEPVAKKYLPKHGMVEKFGCTEPGCDWAVYVAPRGAEWYQPPWESPWQTTRRLFLENSDPEKMAKARKILAAAETITEVMPEDPDRDL